MTDVEYSTYNRALWMARMLVLSARCTTSIYLAGTVRQCLSSPGFGYGGRDGDQYD